MSYLYLDFDTIGKAEDSKIEHIEPTIFKP